MARLSWAAVLVSVSAVGACQAFGGLGGLQFTGTASGGGGTGGSGGSQGGGRSPGTGGNGNGGPGGSGVGSTTVSTSASTSTTASSSSGGPNGLDPDLDTPGIAGTRCTNYGFNTSPCTDQEVCRISSQDGGTCQGTTNPHERGGPCTTGLDCDILFECYKGKCTNFCILGTTQCGPVKNCIDVGNNTEGVCWPVN